MILKGNCLDTLKTLETASVDSIVTDPPYELGFMGKSWDNSGIAYNQDLWAECLRVLKPGGHLLAFSGSRTYHRMVVAIEDSGCEIRDQIMWLYGSGFPKSLDVSKAIDKSQRGNRVIELIGVLLDEGATLKELGEKSQIPSLESSYRDWVSGGHRPEERSWERLLSGLGFSEKDGLDIISRKTVSLGGGNAYSFRKGEKRNWEIKEIAPSTAAAKQWDGWGTALKPAHEPIVVARKPLIGTVANNVLTYGTGALNIDGTRVGESARPLIIPHQQHSKDKNTHGSNGFGGGSHAFGETILGRWPANVIHDGSDEVLAGFPDTGKSTGGRIGKKSMGDVTNVPAGQYEAGDPGYGDSGSAARFFYCAKASKSERNAGLEGLPERNLSDRGEEGMRDKNSIVTRHTVTQNFHPTVKPLALMRYLIKLVTPPNGIVLDPFLGSGTTAVAATLEGFEWIGCEMTEDYFPIIEARVAWAQNERNTEKATPTLFERGEQL